MEVDTNRSGTQILTIILY